MENGKDDTVYIWTAPGVAEGCAAHMQWATFTDLDEWEGGSGAQGLRLVLHLEPDVVLHALRLVDLLLLLHVEEHPGGHGDGDRVLRLGLGRLDRVRRVREAFEATGPTTEVLKHPLGRTR